MKFTKIKQLYSHNSQSLGKKFSLHNQRNILFLIIIIFYLMKKINLTVAKVKIKMFTIFVCCAVPI